MVKARLIAMLRRNSADADRWIPDFWVIVQVCHSTVSQAQIKKIVNQRVIVLRNEFNMLNIKLILHALFKVYEWMKRIKNQRMTKRGEIIHTYNSVIHFESNALCNRHTNTEQLRILLQNAALLEDYCKTLLFWKTNVTVIYK